jgi:hypothetical protein
MKLRFRKNSLRLRVNRKEVELLASGAALEERISFPGDTILKYVLEASATRTPEAVYQDGWIRVSTPLQQVTDWASGTDIGIYFELPANGSPLKVAIEKDLECVDGPAEETDPDAFPRANGNTC